MEWKDGRRQPPHKMRSTTHMHRAWYLFRTGADLPDIDQLPFIDSGRRVPYRTFRAAIDELVENYPDARGILTDKQQDWTSALEQHTNIDPTLFGYQMRMNDAETGAEQLLRSFDSPDNVVRFFVTALNDHRELEVFTGKLDAYAALAAQRTDLEDRLNFGETVVPLIEHIEQQARDRASAESEMLRAVNVGGEHAAALDNRIEQDTLALAELNASVESAGRTFAEARRDYGQVSDIRQQLQLEQARARVIATEQAVRDTTRRENEAEDAATAWNAVSDVLDLRIKREAAAAARQAYAEAELGLGPLRNAVAQTAAQLAGRLDALIEEAAEGAECASEQADAAKQQRNEAEDDETQSHIRTTELTGKRTRARTDIDNARAAIAAAVGAGWLAEHESASECLQRWQNTRADATHTANEAATRQNTAEQLFDELQGEIDTIAADLVKLRSRAQSAADKLAGYSSDLGAVCANETVVELAGGEPADSAALTRIAALAAQAAEAADTRARTHNTTAQAAHQQMEVLDLTGVAPTGQDVLDVLEVLLGAGIGSVTGLHWIETNIADPNARASFIMANPDVAGGVVISDRNRFSDGVRHLRESRLFTRTPVTVTIPPTTTTSSLDAPYRHVVVPHRATWDRQWAADMRRTLEETARTEEQHAQQAVATARLHRDCNALCTGFVRRWGAVTRTELDTAARTIAGEVSSAETEHRARVNAQTVQRAIATEARADHARWTRETAIAGKHVLEAQALVEVCRTADKAETALTGLDAALRRATDDRQQAAARRDQAEKSYESALQLAANLRSDCEIYRTERAQLGVDTSAPDPGGNPAVLRERWRELRAQLRAAEHGMLEAGRLDEAETAVSEAISRIGRYTPQIVRHAEDLSDTVEASTATTLADAQRRAREAHDAAHKARLRAEADYELAVAARDAAQPPSPDHQNYIDLSLTEWSPATPDDIPALLERLEAHNLELRARREAAETEYDEAKQLRDAVHADLGSFTHTRDMWAAERVPSVMVFTGPASTARELMREYVKAHQRTDKHLREARDAVHMAVVRARACAADPQFSNLETPDAIRLRSLPEPDLVGEAAVLARRIRALTDSAQADLEQLDTHRSMLCDDLMALCRTQRRMLREVSRSSRLPAGLGGLSDNPTIKIRFDEAPAAEAMARLANRVDAWSSELVDNPKKAKSSEVRARWLADAVRDTVVNRARAGAWSIEILKPRIDGRVAYCPPDRIPHEFSGGQVLTLAVLVYCALSQVRSAHRHGGARPAGALLLDNPFGAASAEPLLEMQHRLAAHTGVQLVCATGLHDPAVESAFTGAGSVIVKLRNDGDLRRNLSFLQLRAAVVDGIDVVESVVKERDPRSTQNWVDAVRYEVHR
ncbi:hypothetical protein [Nocardia gipuzkoensis]